MMNKHGWLTISCIVVAGLVAMNFTIQRGQVGKLQQVEEGRRELGFPFEVFSERRIDSLRPMQDAMIILNKEYYSRYNLDRLFQWYLERYPDNKVALTVGVFTNRDKIKIVKGPVLMNDKRLKGVSYDAILYRERRGSIDSKGENAWYQYRPNLNDPNERKTVVLRGTDPYSTKDIIEEWEAKEGDLKIRVAAYELNDVEPSRRYYTLYFFDQKLNGWNELLSFRLNDNISVSRNQVRFVNGQIAFAFLGWVYVGTTDGGKTWFQWDMKADMPNSPCCDAVLIRDVQLTADGSGTMTLNLNSPQPGEVLILYTKDYGRHWKAA